LSGYVTGKVNDYGEEIRIEMVVIFADKRNSRLFAGSKNAYSMEAV
jgi:hypothetical protein